MYLLHKAFRGQALQLTRDVEKIGSDLASSLHPIRLEFNTWATALAYHAETEDNSMAVGLQDLKPLKDNMASHLVLEAQIEEVFKCLNDEIGRQSMVGQTWRHLYYHVIALRTGQNDHLDEEEEFVLPIIRERMGVDREAQVMRQLLVDEAADKPYWIVDWVAQFLTEGERKLVESLAQGAS